MEVFSAQNVHNIIIYCNDLVDDCIRRTGGGQEEGVVAGEGDWEHQVERVQPQLHRDVLHEGKCEEKYVENISQKYLEDRQEDGGRGGVTHDLNQGSISIFHNGVYPMYNSFSYFQLKPSIFIKISPLPH